MNLDHIADSIQKLLASRSLDGWELYLASSRTFSVEVKDQKVDSLRVAAPTGVSIRVLKDGGLGFSFSTSFGSADLEAMIDNALVAAKVQSPDPCNCLAGPAACPTIDDLFDHDLVKVPEERKIESALELERIARSHDSRIARLRKASYSESSFEVMLCNSHGVRRDAAATSATISITAIAEENGDSQTGWDFARSRRFSDLDVAKVGRGAAEKALSLLGATKIETMHAPVVLDTFVATEILEVLAPAFVAENVQKGKSMLAGRLGKEIFSPLVHIVDDGTLPGGIASFPFDGEGTPCRRTILADGGCPIAYLYDCRTACKDGSASTGNSGRGGVKGPPRPSITNLFIENGATDPFHLYAGIARGMLVTDVMGMHTANAITGDFSVGASGFLIENGSISHAVKGMVISGNILDLFRNVEMVGNDLRFYGSVGAPSLRIAGLDISGR